MICSAILIDPVEEVLHECHAQLRLGEHRGRHWCPCGVEWEQALAEVQSQ